MQEQVYRTMTVLCTLFALFPVGTNLGLLHLAWMMLSGRLLSSRGALFPGLSATGLGQAAVRRAWAALRYGAWATSPLLARWRYFVEQEGHWHPHAHDGYHPLPADITYFERPRLQGCSTKHYLPKRGKAVPAIAVGIVARVGSVAGQRLALPLEFVRPPATDPGPEAHNRAVVRAAKEQLGPDDLPIFDRGFHLSLLQDEGCSPYVVRLPTNFTARRAALPPYRGTGRRPTRGALVRPLARMRKGQVYPASPPDRSETWEEDGFTLQAQWWDGLLLPQAPLDSPSFRVVAITDPRYEEPSASGGLALPLAVSGAVARALYVDRWPVEQIPLAAKQMIGAERQFVSAPESRERLPELALISGSVLSYLAATLPAVPTGFWDRHPKPTPGRLRRVLARWDFPECFVLPRRIRQKASVTAHLRKGHWGQRRRPAEAPAA